MSLRRRIFLTLCLVVILGFLGLAHWVRGELRNSYSQVVEELLVDSSHFLSAFLEQHHMSQESLDLLDKVFKTYKSHHFKAPIFDFTKSNPTLEAYVVDKKGIVIFATESDFLGQDFSKWNDVYKTLKGDYGARSTRVDPKDSRTSIYFVAAPIVFDSQIQGAVTIYKTESSILVFLDQALKKMFVGSLFSVLVMGLLGGLIMIWITLPLEKLRQYALDVSEGRRSLLPTTSTREIRQLSEAFEKMRISLEGKKAIEQYTQTLSHELKSPLTAIKGAAELCLEEMDSRERAHFLNNIINEANRSHSILEEFLKIAALETKRKLDQVEFIDPVEVLNETRDALIGLWKPKNIKITILGESHVKLKGDKFLIFQSFRNILQNAIEFTPLNGKIEIQVRESLDQIRIEFLDEGTGIPSFAQNRLFEKFYSLERPDTKRKSSGLGLSFVKEAMELHRGLIEITSPVSAGVGTRVTVAFPRHNEISAS